VPRHAKCFSLISIGILAGVIYLCLTLANAGEEPLPVELALPHPEIDIVRPNTASVAGGTLIKIEGQRFDDLREGVIVKFGGIEAPRVFVDTPERLRVTLPPMAESGIVDVEVINPDNSRAVAKSAFCYIEGNRLAAFWFTTKLRLQLGWRYARLGGWIVLALIAISICGLAWSIHLFLQLRSSEIMPEKFFTDVSSRIERGEIESASRLCERENYAFARIVGAGLKKMKDFPDQVRPSIEAAGSREASHLQQKISYLSNIGVICPMLGLLGTIIGMIGAFEAIAEQGSQYVYLAAAIYKAMITTYGGLMVGIPAMILYFYFRGRVLRLVTSMEEDSERIAEVIENATGASE